MYKENLESLTLCFSLQIHIEVSRIIFSYYTLGVGQKYLGEIIVLMLHFHIPHVTWFVNRALVSREAITYTPRMYERWLGTRTRTFCRIF